MRVKVKRNLCSLLIAILLLGALNIPVISAEKKSNVTIEITNVEKDSITGEATKQKMSMYGYLYITVYWKKENGTTTITGLKRAWTDDPYMKLIDAWTASTYGKANFWDDTHHAGDSVRIDASEI
ncbi:hypothetical protein [Syntrophomonas curvata]